MLALLRIVFVMILPFLRSLASLSWLNHYRPVLNRIVVVLRFTVTLSHAFLHPLCHSLLLADIRSL